MSSYYIHGGRDLKEGALDNMWRINLNDLNVLANDVSYGLQWELVQQKGNGPKKISHHTIAIDSSSNKAVLVGGLQGDFSNSSFYVFDIGSSSWTAVSDVNVRSSC